MMAKRQVTSDDGTVYSIVYVTATPTFTGVIGGYTTLTDGSSAETIASSSAAGQTLVGPTSAAASSNVQSFSGIASTPDSSVAQSSAFSSSAIASTAAFTSAASTFLTATSDSSNSYQASNTAVAGASSSSSSDSSSSSPSSSSNGGGMSTGAKAGIAIAIIAIIGIIAALLLWFLGKKRREKEEHNRANDEKQTFGASHNAVPLTRNPTSATAPRLSLRPMSRMMDGFMGNNNRRSGGNLLNTISEGGAAAGAAGAARNMSPSPQPRAVQEKPRHENPFADPQNPFEDPVAAPVRASAPAPVRPPPTSQPSQPRTKFNPNAAPIESKAMNFDAPSPAPTLPASSPIAPLALGAIGGGAAAAGIAAAASKPAQPQRPASPEEALPIQKHSPPASVRDETISPSPDSAPMPPTIAGAIRSPSPSGTSDAPGGNVYRVLMDFAPSMDDELELNTGQLVRMLHEYDDGWALCIRLDRSQQGVAPRTCLAAKPSKPKPSHLGQYARNAGPAGRPGSPGMGRPESPAMQRSMSPSMGRAGSPSMGRPGSPAMQRAMSPALMAHPESPAGGRGPRNGPPRGPPPRGAPRGPPGPPMGAAHNRPLSPGAYNLAPRPLSPGPRPQQRSQSPGPYGAGGRIPMPGAQQRRRSNSASHTLNRMQSPPPGPSNLGMRPMSPGIAF